MRERTAHSDDFVLEKSIFSNIFDKDIRRVYIYKKAERLAKAIHLVTPAFAESVSLKNRLDAVAVGLVDAACLPPGPARAALSRELLMLSSMLSIARTGGLLSTMNAELIAREAHLLLQEVAAYEEPRLFLDEAPSLADIARKAGKPGEALVKTAPRPHKGQIKDRMTIKDNISDRRDTILEVLREKEDGASIRDVSTLIRGVSEKTIQRELQGLILEGLVRKEGERRWSTYHIA